MKIRVATLNVAWAGNQAKRETNYHPLQPLDLDALARSIAALDADVVAFQEIVVPEVLADALARIPGQPLTIEDPSKEKLASRMPASFPYPDSFQHVVLAWRPERLRLEEWTRVPGRFVREPVAARFATPAGARLTFCALHLKSPDLLDGAARQSIRDTRHDECAALRAWLLAADPATLAAGAGPRAVVAGDLNGTIDGKRGEAGQLSDLPPDGAGDPAMVPLRDTLAAAGWSWTRASDATGGFAWTTITDHAVIDHVLASPGLVAPGASPRVHRLDQEDPAYLKRVTDHRPVTLDIEA